MNKNFIEKRKMYSDADSGKVFFFAIIGILALSLIFSLIASAIASGSGGDAETIKLATEKITESLGFNVTYSIANFVMLVLIFFFNLKVENISLSSAKINFKMKWHTYLICIAIGLIALFGLQYIVGAFDDFLILIGFPVDNSTAFSLDTFGSFALATLCLALIPAIAEELIFRGVILNGLRSRFSSLVAILLSSGMFALMHMSLQQIFYQFMLGAIMAWVVIKTGSCIASMLIHFTSNFMVVLLEYIKNVSGFSVEIAHTWWFYILAVALACLTGLIIFLINKFYFKQKEETIVRTTKTSGYLYLSLAIGGSLFLISTISSFIIGL